MSQIDQRGQQVDTQYNYVIQSPPPLLNVNQIGEPVGDFVGREREIQEVLAAFEADTEGRGPVICGLCGMGGVGKTELAKMVATRVKGRFPDGQVFLDLRGARGGEIVKPATATEMLQHVVRSFLPEALLPDTVEQLDGMCRSVLANKRVLLLMDDALDATQIKALVPPPEGCSLIVTSRRHILLPEMCKVDLDVMPPEEARALLVKICPRIAEHAEVLAESCGYLALALRLAASALELKQAMSVQDYLGRLHSEKTRLLNLDKITALVGVDQGVEASFAASYRLFDVNLQRLWRSLVVFPGDFDARAAAVVCGMEVPLAEDALGELYLASALIQDNRLNRYRLHDLTREFLLSFTTQKELQEFQQRHAEHYMQVMHSANSFFRGGGGLDLAGAILFDFEYQNICSGQIWAAKNGRGNRAALRLTSDYAARGASLIHLRLNLQKQAKWFEAGLAASRELQDSKAEAIHVNNLGVAYAALGKLDEAVTCYETRLSMANIAEDQKGKRTALNNLGNALKKLDKVESAVKVHRQCLSSARQDGDGADEATAFGNVASDYLSLGLARKAVKLYKQSLEKYREFADSSGEAIVLSGLGDAYAKLKYHSEAVVFYKQSLDLARRLRDRHGQVYRLRKIAEELVNAGQADEAAVYEKEATDVLDRITDPRAANLGARLEWIAHKGSANEDVQEAD